MYKDIHGFSCVENQVLAILRSRGINIAPLYYECAMPLKEIFFFMVVTGKKQEYFDRVPRIQEALKKLGVITLVLKEKPNMISVRNAIRACRGNEYILMKVTPEFTRKTLLARGLRDDHFVLAGAVGNDYVIQNDIPERTTVLPASEIGKAYGGKYLKLTVNRAPTEDDINILWDIRKFKPENYVPFYFHENDLEAVSNIGTKLRNMTGVYRILRYRLAKYYGLYLDTCFVYDALFAIDKYYATFEYYNLKKSTPNQKYLSLFSEMNSTEIKIMWELKKRLEKQVDDKRNSIYSGRRALHH